MLPLRVSANGTHLCQADGTPFFWLADTAWELLHRLDRGQIRHYLADRAAKRFNVIQTVVLSEMNGLSEPNAEGHLVFHDQDPSRPVEGCFELVDWFVDECQKYGLYAAILPTWGSFCLEENHPLFPHPVVFHPGNAAAYGRFLAARYRDRPNLVWVLGGDRSPAACLETWRAMAAGLREGGARQPITYHPPGGHSSSEWLNDEPWLDFHMVQSGHARARHPNWEMVAADWNRSPRRPVLESEPLYENHPIAFNPHNGRASSADVRSALYHAVFSGSCGVTYGCSEVWQMAMPGRFSVLEPTHTWKEALQFPVAGQVRHLRALMESRPMAPRRPDAAVTATCPGHDYDHASACSDSGPDGGGTYLMIYTPCIRPLEPVTSGIGGRTLRAWWFNPRDGGALRIAECPNTGKLEKSFLSTWNLLSSGPDWVLVVDDAGRGYPPPGIKP